MAKAGAELVKRLRDYATEEPSYTCAFAAWELGLSSGAIRNANEELLRLKIIEEIEPGSGPYGAVYRYKPIPAQNGARRRLFPELDNAIGVGAQAPTRGQEVPLTGQPKGPSGKPSLDRKRGRAGHRVKRNRQGT